MIKSQTPFKILTAAIFILLIVPTLIKDGMFMDGEQYACVSKNMAEGLGSFWHPYFSKTWMNGGSNVFLEQPPLVWGIQSLLFKLMGNTIYVERLYSFITALISAFVIVKTWKLINIKNQTFQNFSWLPVLLWIITPVCFWAYQNNVQENTMGVFTLSAVYFAIKGILNNKYFYLWVMISGIFIFLASLSKGVPGLFPIATIGIYWFATKNISFKKMCIGTIILILTPIVIYGLLLLFSKEANEGLSFYFYKRLLSRIQDAPTVTRRGYILFRIFSEQIPAMLFCLIAVLIARIKSIKTETSKQNNQFALFFFLVGVAGSAPLTLTLVQKGFYFVPSLPFFALGFALLIAPYINNLTINLKANFIKLFFTFSIVILIAAIGFSISQYGKKRKHIDILEDVYTIGAKIPSDIIVSVEPKLFYEWSLQTNFMRHFKISIDGNPNLTYKYYIIEKSSTSKVPDNYSKVDISTKKYNLYQLTE